MSKPSKYELEVLAQIEKVQAEICLLEIQVYGINETIVTKADTLKTLTDIHESASGVKKESDKEGKKE